MLTKDVRLCRLNGRHSAHPTVEQNRYAVAPVSAPGITTPRAHNSSSNILTVNGLVGILVIFSPKLSTYDTIKKAHDRTHATQRLQPQDDQKLCQPRCYLCPPRRQKP
jgi:hypothetical protein